MLPSFDDRSCHAVKMVIRKVMIGALIGLSNAQTRMIRADNTSLFYIEMVVIESQKSSKKKKSHNGCQRPNAVPINQVIKVSTEMDG